jgi:hypothetical protein
MFLNYLLDNNLVFYGIFAGVACHLGLSLLTSTWYSETAHWDKGVQTDAWEDYSDTPSQILVENLTSSEPVSQGISPVTTVLPVRPMEIEVVPNPDILNIENISNLIDKGVQTMPAENIVIITEMIPIFS